MMFVKFGLLLVGDAGLSLLMLVLLFGFDDVGE